MGKGMGGRKMEGYTVGWGDDTGSRRAKKGENCSGNERKRREEERRGSQIDAEISVVKWMKC